MKFTSASDKAASVKNKQARTTGLSGALAVVAVVSVLASPALAQQRAEASNRPSNSTIGRDVSEAASGGGKHYWTPERMKRAKPAEPRLRAQHHGEKPEPVARGERVSIPGQAPSVEAASATATSTAATSASTGGSVEGYWQGSNVAAPARQVGKLFFQQWNGTQWVNTVCSASVVAAENRSVVWTAGHCVFETHRNVWNRNYVFCPGYLNGSCPLGKWTPYRQATTFQWQNAVCTAYGTCTQNEFNHDFGLLKMNLINGYTIQDWVGAHGLIFNGATTQYRYAFGYPVNKSSGQYLYVCQATNGTHSGHLTIPCTAGGGASGGPWLSNLSTWGAGQVHSVNSHGGATYMGGPYQGTVAHTLYNNNRY